MRNPTPNRSAAIFTLLAVLVAMLALCGCPFSQGDDDDPPVVVPPSRNTDEEVLTNWFKNCYSQQDSILYEEMLDDEFQFEFLPEDADSLREILGQFNYWGKTLDLKSTGGLFRTQIVTEITLNINVETNNPYTGSGCEGCSEIETVVSLRVGTTETSEGTPLVLAVDSPQIFVVKPDPDAAGKWVIWRQFDRPRG